MKKIVFYCISTHLGGAEQSLLTLLKSLSKKNETWSLNVVVPKTEGPLIDEIKKHNITYSVLSMPLSILEISRQESSIFTRLANFFSLLKLPCYLWQLVQFVRKEKPDLIYTTGLKCHLFTGLTASLLNCQVVWHLRDILKAGTFTNFFNLLGRQKNISLISNSAATAQSVQLPSKVIYNGFDFPLNSPEKNFLHKKLNLNTNIPLVGILGVIANWKGQDDFLKIAADLVHEKQINAHFVIIGGEIYDTKNESLGIKQLKDLASQLNISEKVHFTGFIKETNQALSSLTVLIHASKQPEPFGRVIVEAMINKTPVVASEAGGVVEIIENDQLGLLSPPSDIKDYSKKTAFLISNPQLAQEISDNAFSYCEKKFSKENYILSCEEFFLKVLKEKKSL